MKRIKKNFFFKLKTGEASFPSLVLSSVQIKAARTQTQSFLLAIIQYDPEVCACFHLPKALLAFCLYFSGRIRQSVRPCWARKSSQGGFWGGEVGEVRCLAKHGSLPETGNLYGTAKTFSPLFRYINNFFFNPKLLNCASYVSHVDTKGYFSSNSKKMTRRYQIIHSY